MAKDKTLFVKSNLPARPDGGTPCAFWEEDPAHPLDPNTKRHEVFVAGDDVVEVGATSQVRQALKDERLVETDQAATPKPDLSQAPAPTPMAVTATQTPASSAKAGDGK